MIRAPSRFQRRALERENAKLPLQLQDVPREQWPVGVYPPSREPVRLLRSRDFLVQVFAGDANVLARLSINRTVMVGDRWAADITWDQLQELKSQAGYGDHDAVEVYPRDRDVVNVANMRHLWVLQQLLPFVWRDS